MTLPIQAVIPRKISSFLLLQMLLLSFFSFSCEENPEFDYPIIFTGQVTEVDNQGATFHARIPKFNLGKITEYGFVWSQTSPPSIRFAETVLIPEAPSARVFSTRINERLKKGTTYYVRAFIRNEERIIYGKEQSFNIDINTPPKVHGFSPKIGNILDTVKISGEYLSDIRTENQVMFGPFEAPVIEATQDTLWVLVPEDLNEQSSTISISIEGFNHTFPEKFELFLATATDFSPKNGTFGTEVSITGRDFLPGESSLRVYFEETLAEVIDIQEQELQVKVPNTLNKRQSQIQIFKNNIPTKPNGLFQLNSLSLTDYSPKIATRGDTIYLEGNNFSPAPSNNKVQMDGFEVKVVEASPDKLKIVVPPAESDLVFSSRNVKLSVEVVGEKLEYQDELLLNDQLFRLKNAPISSVNTTSTRSYSSVNTFVVQGKVYLGLNCQLEFWEYIPANDSWTRLADFPGLPRCRGVGFTIGTDIYFGTGTDHTKDLGDWWVYSTTNDTWTRKNNFPGNKRAGAFGFSMGGVGYIGTGSENSWTTTHLGFRDIWKYVPSTDSWTQVSDYPIIASWGMSEGIALTEGNHAYAGLGNIVGFSSFGNIMHRYDPVGDLWTKVKDYPLGRFNNFPIAFYLSGKLHVKTSTAQFFYTYDEISDTWVQTGERVPNSYSLGKGIGFAMGNKAYFGLGSTNAIWEFDPSR